MAHLLEHMLFKGSKNFPDVKAELTRRGGRWNGTTSNDRTNYFETFSATPENLDWALSLEADRMVNSRVSREDLDSEMTVVRNEFGDGREQSRLGALPAHAEARLCLAQLRRPDHRRARRHRAGTDRQAAGVLPRVYQPDNAVLLIAGRFDENRAARIW